MNRDELCINMNMHEPQDLTHNSYSEEVRYAGRDDTGLLSQQSGG